MKRDEMEGRQKSFVWQVNAGGPETYERYIVPAWMGEWAQVLVDAGGVGPGSRVLDVACGTGIVARKAAPLAGPGGRAAGLDANEGMLFVAGKRAVQEGMPSIEWYKSDVCQMPFSLAEFDTILCQQGLQFFPDRNAALQEMARVLAPEGRLALSVWGSIERSPFAVAVTNALGHYFGADATGLFDVASSLADREVLRNLVRDAGFHNIHIRVEVRVARHPSLAEFLPAYLSIFPFAGSIASMPEKDRAAMFEGIETSMEAYMDDDGLAVPSECLILTAENGNSCSREEL